MKRGSQKLVVKSANVSLLSLLRRLLAICCCRKAMVFSIERGLGVGSNMHMDEWHTTVCLLVTSNNHIEQQCPSQIYTQLIWQPIK